MIHSACLDERCRVERKQISTHWRFTLPEGEKPIRFLDNFLKENPRCLFINLSENSGQSASRNLQRLMSEQTRKLNLNKAAGAGNAAASRMVINTVVGSVANSDLSRFSKTTEVKEGG